MPLLNPYCTVRQVQDEIRNQDPELGVQIEEAINHASRFIDQHKGRDFLFHDHTTEPLLTRRFHNRVFQSLLQLPYSPVLTLTELKVNEEVWLAGTDFVVDQHQIFALDADWPLYCDSDVISIKGTFGYEQESTADVPTGLPERINRAAILIAAALSGHNQKEVVGVEGTKATVIDKAIPRTALDILGSRGIVI